MTRKEEEKDMDVSNPVNARREMRGERKR